MRARDKWSYRWRAITKEGTEVLGSEVWEPGRPMSRLEFLEQLNRWNIAGGDNKYRWTYWTEEAP